MPLLDAENRPNGAPRLYAVLGVPQDASTQQIRSAYRKLALKCHPDKTQELPAAEQAAAAEKFKVINEAHTVLSDPQKRKFYDRFGDSVINLDGNEFLVPLLNSLGMNVGIAVVATFIFLLSTFILCAFAFIAAKVDGKLERMSWTAVLWPIWVIFAILLIFSFIFLCILCVNIGRDGGNENAKVRPQQLVPVLVIIGYFVWVVLIAVRLGGSSINAYAVFAPVIFAELIITLLSILVLNPKEVQKSLNELIKYREQQLQAQGDAVASRVGGKCNPISIPPAPFWMVLSIVLTRAVVVIHRLAFFIILPLFIDQHTSASWFVVTIPWVLLAASRVFNTFVEHRLHAHCGMSIGCCATCCAMLGSLFLSGIFLIPFFLVCAKLEGSNIALALCFIPYFIFFGVLWIASLCGCCFGCRMAGADYDTMLKMDQEGHGDSYDASMTTGAAAVSPEVAVPMPSSPTQGGKKSGSEGRDGRSKEDKGGLSDSGEKKTSSPVTPNASQVNTHTENNSINNVESNPEGLASLD